MDDRFFEVMDMVGRLHVVTADRFKSSMIDRRRTVFLAKRGGKDHVVASFESPIYVKDVADKAQAGEG